MIIKPKIIGDKLSGDYKVRFFYLDVVDGILDWQILTKYVDNGDTVTAPMIPTSLNAVSKNSCSLEFVSWNHTTLTNVTQDLDIGATYRNVLDGGIRKTHAFIVVTAGTGLTVPVYFNKSDASTLTISWGDGTANYTTTSSGNLNTSHTYSTAGTYEITMWISSGTGTYNFSNGSTTSGFIGGSNNTYRRCLKSLFIGDNVASLSAYALYLMFNLHILNVPTNITTLGNYALGSMRSLKTLILPSSCTSVGDHCFDSNAGIQNIILNGGLTTLGELPFNESDSLQSLIIPNTVTTIGTYPFEGIECLNKVIISTSLTSLSEGFCDYCVNLSNINIPSNITSLGINCFRNCSNVTKITIPNTVTSLGNGVFSGCISLQVLTIQRFSAPSDITNIGTSAISINPALKIYVPVGSLAVYQAATNWSTYANYMYEDTPENRALFGD